MDVVYPCRAGVNDELRFSLRSLVNLPHEQVWLFGARPRWYRGQHVRVPQGRSKHENVRASLQRIVDHPGVSEQFVLMNDDFYVVQPVKKVPQLHLGPIDEVAAAFRARVGDSRYVRLLERTARLLREQGVEEPVSYEVHAPMVMTKTALREALKVGGNPRSVVGNLHGPKGRKTADVKVTHVDQPFPAGSFVSSEDTSFRLAVRPTLLELFPEASPWEFVTRFS